MHGADWTSRRSGSRVDLASVIRFVSVRAVSAPPIVPPHPRRTPPHRTHRLEQYLGLVVAALAMIVYNLKPELDVNGRSVEGAHAFESRPTTVQVQQLSLDKELPLHMP